MTMYSARMIDIKKEYFGAIADEPIYLYTLCAGFVTLRVMNYGATITAIEFPDRNDQMRNVVAGFANLEDYLKPHPYLGATVGRFANRITHGKFILDGKQYQLSINDDPNHLHGGINGFHQKVWKPVSFSKDDGKCSLKLVTCSNDGEEGYPGNVEVSVKFTVKEDNEIEIAYYASTDKATPLNLTSHSYFNLSGFTQPTILDHELKVYSTFFNEKCENDGSTGKFLMCAQTPHDFRQPKKIGLDIHKLKEDGGYNHNHVIDDFGQGIRPVARLIDPDSGRMLKIQSDMPGLQVYTANLWDGCLTGAQGVPYEKHGAIALETQRFPDSPNHPSFPNSIHRPGEDFCSKTIYHFGVKGD